MKEDSAKSLPQDKDRHLDVPAEARRDKHINFLDEDSNDANERSETERQKQWKEGLEEGRKIKDGEG